jgi:hypothetical protein
MLLTTTRTESPRGLRLAGEVDLSNEAELSRLLAREATTEPVRPVRRAP